MAVRIDKGPLASNQYAASVSNSDGTLTISPTTGAVVASLNTSHANTWNATQTMSSSVAMQFKDASAKLSSSVSGTLDVYALTILNLGTAVTTLNLGTTSTTVNLGTSCTNFICGPVTDIVLGSSGYMLGVFGNSGGLQQTDGAGLTNNMASSGTTNTIPDFTSLTVYATDAQAIHDAIYQLARKLKITNDALRTYGFLT